MKIRLIGEIADREVELLGKVLCVRSDIHDMSWEFEKDKAYDLYEQIFEDGTKLYIVFNEGWYANFDDINALTDRYYDFNFILISLDDEYIMHIKNNGFPTPDDLHDAFTYDFLKYYNKFYYNDCDANYDEALKIKECIIELKNIFNKMKNIYDKH
jgi:hypothetical protein